MDNMILVWIAVGIISFLLLLLILRLCLNGPKSNLKKLMIGKLIIVTGSNAGIGKATALELLEQGAKVIFACRNKEKTEEVINSIREEKMKENAFFMKLDLSSFNSIVNFVEEFKKSFLFFDMLINNAGSVFYSFSTKENIETSLMTNHIGPVVLTSLMIKMINPGGKIINVSSQSHRHVTNEDLAKLYSDPNFTSAERNYSFLRQYGITKIGNVYHAKHMTEYFSKNNINIKAASVHPGLVYSDIWYSLDSVGCWAKIGRWIISPFLWLVSKNIKMGAQTTMQVVYTEYENLNSGDYYEDCKVKKIGKVPNNLDQMRTFMSFTKDLIAKNMTEIPEEVNEYFS